MSPGTLFQCMTNWHTNVCFLQYHPLIMQMTIIILQLVTICSTLAETLIFIPIAGANKLTAKKGTL